MDDMKTEDPPPEAEEGADEAEEKKVESTPPARRGVFGTILVVAGLTVVGCGLGAFIGMQLASGIEKTIADRAHANPPQELVRSTKYSGDMTLQPLQAVVTNLAQPSDVWIRLETAIVFANGAVKNPEVTAGEIRQDIVSYARTITLAQLEGPSALQHLREDLNERVAIRTGGQVNELLIQALVVQ